MQTIKFKTLMVWTMIVGALLLIGACAEGGGYAGPYYERPGYNSPYNFYSPYYYNPDDPEFWQQWQNSQGGG